MASEIRLFKTGQPHERGLNLADLVVLLAVGVVVYIGVRLSLDAPRVIHGPEISLSPLMLPFYAVLSVGRMLLAYILSLVFSIIYGYVAANNKRAEKVLLPLLDVLQSVPILSFLPVVLLSFSALLPASTAAELASVVLIFTSQAWNMTFAWYQSLTTIPTELREASAIFRLNAWLRLKTLQLPFAALSLIWNSMMSWSGGWFFLMAAEIFTVGQRDFRLPGLGAYLSVAANQGNILGLAYGIAALVVIIVLLDQFVWRPLLAWADRFKLEMVESENPPTSWFYEVLSQSRLVARFGQRVIHPLIEKVDALMGRWLPASYPVTAEGNRRRWQEMAVFSVIGLGLAYGAYRAFGMLVEISMVGWGQIVIGLATTLLRVITALIITLAWTVPLGVLIGTNKRAASVLQPLVQVMASIPATALFPAFLLILIALPAGLNIASVLLMLMGTQWYLLFNVIAGAAAIPQDLKYTATMLGLSRAERWRTLILPALFPYLVTGSITASGGAWNASIVAEYTVFGGRAYHVTGIGAVISQATASGNFPMLLGATLSMIVAVVLINRLFWRRLYHIAEEQYRME